MPITMPTLEAFDTDPLTRLGQLYDEHKFVRSETRATSPVKRARAKTEPVAQGEPIDPDTLKKNDRLVVAGVDGVFLFRKLSGSVVNVYGGTKGREQSRSFDLAKVRRET